MTSARSGSPRETAPPSRAGGCEIGTHGLVTGRRDTASSASIRICSTPCRQSRARTVAAHASRGFRRASRPWTARSRPPAPSARRLSGRPRNACSQTPSTAIAGYRSSSAESSKCASQRSTVVTRARCGSTQTQAHRRAWRPHRCRPPRPSSRSPPPAGRSPCTTQPLSRLRAAGSSGSRRSSSAWSISRNRWW